MMKLLVPMLLVFGFYAKADLPVGVQDTGYTMAGDIQNDAQSGDVLYSDVDQMANDSVDMDGHRMPPPHRMPPHRRGTGPSWTCYSQDRVGFKYWGDAFDQATAEVYSVNNCHSRSVLGGCYLVGCYMR